MTLPTAAWPVPDFFTIFLVIWGVLCFENFFGLFGRLASFRQPKKSFGKFRVSIWVGWAPHPAVPAWAIAARIVFAMLPTSAPCERVFSEVKEMLGKDQLASVSDVLQGSVMMRYNKRIVG